jgi:hypothetical protein
MKRRRKRLPGSWKLETTQICENKFGLLVRPSPLEEHATFEWFQSSSRAILSY